MTLQKIISGGQTGAEGGDGRKKWQRITTESFIERSKQVHGDEAFDYSLTQYTNSVTRVALRCRNCDSICHHLPNNHLVGRGCKTCQYKRLSQNQPKSHEWFLARALEVHGTQFEYLSTYVNKRTKIKIRCLNCQSVFDQRSNSHLEGTGCAKCYVRRSAELQVMSTDIFEAKCQTVHPGRYEYFQDYSGSDNYIKIRCKKHDFIFPQNASAHLHKKQGCPICSSSRGEEAVRCYLEARSVLFEYQKRYPDCRNRYPLPFDFYLTQYNACIEYDGEFHHQAYSRLGGESRLEQTRLNDQKKSEYCKQAGIGLLRIPYWEKDNLRQLIDEFLKGLIQC